MRIIDRNIIYNDPNLFKFLREYSYFEKYFSRRGNVNTFSRLMKEKYSIRLSDKLTRAHLGASILKSILDDSK